MIGQDLTSLNLAALNLAALDLLGLQASALAIEFDFGVTIRVAHYDIAVGPLLAENEVCRFTAQENALLTRSVLENQLAVSAAPPESLCAIVAVKVDAGVRQILVRCPTGKQDKVSTFSIAAEE